MMRASRERRGGGYPSMTTILIIIAIASGVVGVIGTAIGIIGRDGILGIWRSRRQEGRDERKALWESFEKRIELAEGRGSKEDADDVRREYETQLEAWQAQQSLEKIAPREIPAPGEESSLTEGEVEQLKELLARSQPLSAAVLSAYDYFLRGNSYYNASQNEEALRAYDQALILHPDDPNVLYNRGNALGRLGRQDEAIGAYDQSLALVPDRPDTLTNRGVALRGLGRYDEALQAYDQSLTVLPDDASTLSNRGIALGYLRRYDEALDMQDRAIAIRPNDPAILANRGTALAGLGSYEVAIQAYDQSLALRPSDPGTLYNRACLYSLWEKPDEALEDLRRAIDGDSKYREMARKDPELDNIRDDPRFKALVRDPDPEAN